MRKLTLIVPLCTLVIMTVLLVVLAMSKPSKEKLEQAIVGADKLVIEWVPILGQASTRPQITLTGKDKVAEFMECLEFDSTSNVESRVFANACFVRIYKGEKLLAGLLCDFDRMRWDGGEWDGCAILSERSRAVLRKWLTENGFDCTPEKT